MSIAPSWTAAFTTREEAGAVQDALALFAIGTRLREVDDPPYLWWEVTIVELPAGWMATASVVARGPRTTSPSRTEVDEHDRGASQWDLEREWRRDAE